MLPPLPKPPLSRQTRSRAWKVLPLLALLALLVLGGMVWSIQTVFQEREKRFRHQAEWELQAISRLQTQSVSEWRERRGSDAMALSDDTFLNP